MRSFFLKLINFYQRYISTFTPASCRYYPTCSDYAKINFEQNSFLFAFKATCLRILRCNQLFKGGFDHPEVTKKFDVFSFISPYTSRKIKIKFWFVPKDERNFYVIKQIDF